MAHLFSFQSSYDMIWQLNVRSIMADFLRFHSHLLSWDKIWSFTAVNMKCYCLIHGEVLLGILGRDVQSCPILPHCYGPLRAVNGPYVLHKPSLLLTVRMLSTYGACISLLHEGTMRYGSFDPYGPKTYGACISLLHQGTLRYGLFDPYGPKTYGPYVSLIH